MTHIPPDSVTFRGFGQWIAISLISLVGTASVAHSNEFEPQLRAVTEAWEARARSVQSGTIVFEVKVFEIGQANDKIRFSATHSYTWSERGLKQRYHAKGSQPSNVKGTMSLDNTLTNDGAGGWRELTPANERTKYPVGFINSIRWGRRELLPISWHYGMAIGHSALATKNLRVIETNYPLDNHDGILLEDTNTPNYNRRIVVDPELKYSIVRVFQYSKKSGDLERQWEIAYRSNSTEEPEITGWRFSFWASKDRMSTSEEAVFQKTELNGKYPDTLFTIEFPVGAWVYDDIKKQPFLQRENGERRVITDEEQRESLSYDVAMKTQSGEGNNAMRIENGPRSLFSAGWGVWASITGIGVLILAVARYRSRRSAI